MQLIERRPVIGADVFDLQIVATMLANGIQRIYTFNSIAGLLSHMIGSG
jgi:hypothetical protein